MCATHYGVAIINIHCIFLFVHKEIFILKKGDIMPKIRNMGTATMRFGEGIIISGSAGTDAPALIVTGSTVISGSESMPALDVYASLSGQYVAVFDNDQNSSGHVLKLLTDGNGSGTTVLEMIDGDNDTIFRARADGRFGFGPDGVSSMGAGTFVVGIDNSSHAADIAISKRLQHLGDSNTYIDFPTNDQIDLVSGGKNMINTIGSGAGKRVLIVSGGSASSHDESTGSDICFYVSGSVDSATTFDSGASLFGGDLVASGSITTKFGLAVEGYIAINKESATPSQPPDGQGYLYSKTDGKLYWRSHDVTETDLTAGGGGGTSNKVTYLGFVSLQTSSRVVSFDLGTSLSGTANNTIKGMLIAPFNGRLDTIIVSTKGVNVSSSNTGNVAVTAYLNQDNFAVESATVGLAPSDFIQKASGTPNIYSAICDFNLSISQGDLLQFKLQKDTGSNTDTLVTVVLTEN
jgi:hypothetical protein